jgi:class 3 adenylate cyclase
MPQTFAEALVDAQGRSEFVIVVVADIRGFSAFSTTNESPNIAMFIKRFYLQLINRYFKDANFVKPTGDGLLMTFPYSEKNLFAVSEKVINSCLTCLNDFPSICEADAMINFSVPQLIGFGIARGTACCLYSGDDILDYSGHLLNLASRLNDLARPSGIVIDGNYLLSVIPEAQREMFKEQKVYLRSIAEETPTNIFYLEQYVQISDLALSPIVSDNWKTVILNFTKSELSKIGTYWFETLSHTPKSPQKIKVTVITPRRDMKGIVTFRDFKDFTITETPSPVLKLNMVKMRGLINLDALSRTAKISVEVEYVPKSLPRT